MEKLEKDMKPRFIEDLGMLYPTENSTRKYRYGLYECPYCRKEFERPVSNVKRGNTKSCGCLKGDAHGLSQNKFFKRWYSMLERCNNPKNISYTNYGGRGIRVCSEWLDPRNFITWCESTHPNIEGYTLDRIDNDKGYSPENCRWADKTTQAINQRRMKNNKSGYVGVVWYIRDKKWYANIRINKILKQIGSFKTKEEAALARDTYIIENGLPHKLSGLIKN